MERFEYRLMILRDNGADIANLLDIGAYRGEFTKLVENIWPKVRPWQIEADTRQMPYLRPDAINAVLSDVPNKEVDFFTLDTDSITTGSSMYRELTSYYNDPIILKKKTTTLDEVAKRVNFRGAWKQSGMMKLDTQGSELDILRGGANFMQTFQPKYVIIETSVKQYNIGAPLIGEVMAYMYSLGYKIEDMLHHAYDATEALLQVDVLFVRE
jgi:FkbM family methyltransferase